MKIDRAAYVDRDALSAARWLLGKVIVTQFEGALTSGMVTETEAYLGVKDRASHAFGGRHTKRNTSMYAVGGTAYVYLCYGIHHLFNVVVGDVDLPHAVLIRGMLPLDGIDHMEKRRPSARKSTGGPGTLTQALGIRTEHDGEDLTGERIWIDDRGIIVPDQRITIGPRIGVDYAGADSLLPYRFRFAPSQPAGT